MRFAPKSMFAAAFAILASPTLAAPCGNDASGFAAWKQAFAQEAAAAGVGAAGLQALANAQYSQSTINADRNQRGVRYELNEFIRLARKHLWGAVRHFARHSRDGNGFWPQHGQHARDRQHHDRRL